MPYTHLLPVGLAGGFVFWFCAWFTLQAGCGLISKSRTEELFDLLVGFCIDIPMGSKRVRIMPALYGFNIEPLIGTYMLVKRHRVIEIKRLI